jgi:2-polyprenyl-3-methyl-5-hydroxy-6-metoxy-1,4-benzoquinol methylase
MAKPEKFWDRSASTYDGSEPSSDPTHIKTVEAAQKYLDVSDVVLDYGCATGTIALEIADHVKEVHGIDISSKMIEVAKRKAGERKVKNVDFAHATIFDERLKKEAFDVILAFNVLHLLEDPQKAVQRINELLKPGGLIISSTACMGENRASFMSVLLFLVMKIGIIPSLKFFTISELENAIAAIGNFQIVEAESLMRNPTSYFIVAKKI